MTPSTIVFNEDEKFSGYIMSQSDCKNCNLSCRPLEKCGPTKVMEYCKKVPLILERLTFIPSIADNCSRECPIVDPALCIFKQSVSSCLKTNLNPPLMKEPFPSIVSIWISFLPVAT